MSRLIGWTPAVRSTVTFGPAVAAAAGCAPATVAANRTGRAMARTRRGTPASTRWPLRSVNAEQSATGATGATGRLVVKLPRRSRGQQDTDRGLEGTYAGSWMTALPAVSA